MKKKLSIILCLLCLLPVSLISFAYNKEMPQTSVAWFLNKIDGNWYNHNGHVALTIKNGYINSCHIAGAFDFVGGYPGSGIFRINEAAGNRDIHITMFGEEYHKYAIMNHTTPLRQTPNAQYFESVCGVYLGMTPSEVVKLCGKPAQSSIKGIRTHYDYKKQGFSIDFDDNVAVNIIMYNNGTSHFDRTGYTCKNSLADYDNKYKLTQMPTAEFRPYAIGHGEYLFFDQYPNCITLSLYSN